MTVADKLALYGVTVALDGDSLRLVGLQTVPPAEQPAVNALIQEVKANKAAVVEQLKAPQPEPKPVHHKPRMMTAGDEILLRVCREHQDNIRRSGTLRSDIIKGVRAEQDAESLLITACQCISWMTGDTVIYDIVRKEIATRQEENRPGCSNIQSGN